jgi:hypothetical protein
MISKASFPADEIMADTGRLRKKHQRAKSKPQALKRRHIFKQLNGTTEVVPFPKPTRIRLFQQPARTFVSMTVRITYVSHAGMPKSLHRCRMRKACPNLFLAPFQAFSSQSGGGAAVRIKSRTLMITTAGSPRRSTTKRSLFSIARSIIWPNCVRARWASTRRCMQATPSIDSLMH